MSSLWSAIATPLEFDSNWLGNALSVEPASE